MRSFSSDTGASLLEVLLSILLAFSTGLLAVPAIQTLQDSDRLAALCPLLRNELEYVRLRVLTRLSKASVVLAGTLLSSRDHPSNRPWFRRRLPGEARLDVAAPGVLLFHPDLRASPGTLKVKGRRTTCKLSVSIRGRIRQAKR